MTLYEPLAPLLTINETANVLGVSRATVYRFIRKDGLPTVTVGKRKRIRPTDLEAYIERAQGATP